MTRVAPLLVIGAILGLTVLLPLACSRANASPSASGALIEASHAGQAALLSEYIEEVELIAPACTETGTDITDKGHRSLECWNAATNVVYVGPSGFTAATGRPICTTAASCPSSSWSADISDNADLDCRVAAGGGSTVLDAGTWLQLDGGAFIDAGAGVDGGPLYLDGGPLDGGTAQTLRCLLGKR